MNMKDGQRSFKIVCLKKTLFLIFKGPMKKNKRHQQRCQSGVPIKGLGQSEMLVQGIRMCSFPTPGFIFLLMYPVQAVLPTLKRRGHISLHMFIT